ncbi:unnamed protein product [Penicillium pancosmium]
MATEGSWFLSFPPELISSIVSFLPNKDVKSLRLTCKALGDISPFSSSRVFLSANSLNIRVFRAVADHPKFRHEIREIIWDDAQVLSAPLIWETMRPITEPERMEIDPEEGCPIWFKEKCEENRYTTKHRKYRDVDRPDHVARQRQIDAQRPLKACWEYYQQLWDDQKVTVTPAAHGWPFAPLYETPMIRAFPYGFNCPLPRGWHCDPVHDQVAEPLPRPEATEEYKELWRGARIVLRLLSQVGKHGVSELSFDSKQLYTGLNLMIFDQPCEEYNQFAAIMKRPGFQRLHLSLHSGSNGYWTGFQSGLFCKAVSLAKGLTHVHLSTTFSNGTSPTTNDSPIPLKDVLPMKEWPNLSHLALFRFIVDTPELIDILKLAPSSLRSLDLEFLEFAFTDQLCLAGLLERMREELDWAERDQSLKPTVTIAMRGYRAWPGRFIRLSDEVTSFLYGSGELPVDESDTHNPTQWCGTHYDLFEEEYTRPNVNYIDLRKLGITRK